LRPKLEKIAVISNFKELGGGVSVSLIQRKINPKRHRDDRFNVVSLGYEVNLKKVRKR